MLAPKEASSTLPFAHGGPIGSGVIKASAEDFRVDEELGFELTGEGEHVYLRIEKRGENTEFLARRLARFAAVHPRCVSFAGLKDRHALTTQWFSVHLPGKTDPQWSGFNDCSTQVLTVKRHHRKLRRGGLVGNAFRIVVRDPSGSRDCLEARLAALASGGVPNYFGEQRFGREGGNLPKAIALFSGRLKLSDRHKRGLLLSAARAHLFNCVLEERVKAGTWNAPVAGDTFIFDRSTRYFRTTTMTPDIVDRTRAMDIHPTGVLWGTGQLEASGDVRCLELNVAAAHSELSSGLERFDVAMGRRALRARATGMHWDFSGDGALRVAFSLGAGVYATALLRELMTCRDAKAL